MSWLKATGPIIDVVNGSIRIQGENVPYKAWPELASFVSEKWGKAVLLKNTN